METRPDTSSSSGRLRDQWSFLANAPHHAQPRSLPTSSYLLQSDRSSISPHPYYGTSGSRSSLPRNLTTVSVGGRSNATIPSQPVLLRMTSAEAFAHLHTTPGEENHQPIIMGRNNGLPAISEFSIQGILDAIQEDVEYEINTISEILGRSRLVLADQHDSHMPPQGEIRQMSTSLQAVEEASSSTERLAGDDVFILREDASIIDGSHTGSAAYGLLERLQAIPRHERMNTDHSHSPMLLTSPASPVRHNSSPPALNVGTHGDVQSTTNESRRTSRQLLRNYSRNAVEPPTTGATVSETHLFASTNGVVLEESSLFGESLQYLHTDGYGADVRSELSSGNTQRTIRERVQSMLYVNDPTGLTAWLQGQSPGQSSSIQDAESHLRGVLER